MKVLLLGATGLVGRNALTQVLARPVITQVIAPTRKPLPTQDRLMNPVAPKLEEFLPEMANWRPNAVICATGTTSKKAGSKEAFRSVDRALLEVLIRAGSQVAPPAGWTLTKRLPEQPAQMCLIGKADAQGYFAQRCRAGNHQMTRPRQPSPHHVSVRWFSEGFFEGPREMCCA